MGIKGYVVRWVGSGDGKRWCDSPSEAAAEAWGRSLSDRCSDVAIFRVHDDGREERLPSYEEALTELKRLKQREADIVEACERVADGGQYRAGSGPFSMKVAGFATELAMKKLTETQKRALKMVAEDGNADGVYATASGPTPGMARHNADGTMEALRKRGLVVDDGVWQLTDAGREAVEALADGN